MQQVGGEVRLTRTMAKLEVGRDRAWTNICFALFYVYEMWIQFLFRHVPFVDSILHYTGQGRGVKDYCLRNIYYVVDIV